MEEEYGKELRFCFLQVNTYKTYDSVLCKSESYTYIQCFSDYRSSNVGPSDSEKDCPSRRDSESTAVNLPRLGVIPANDSESGGSHSPSPRASRRRQVVFYFNQTF